MLSVDYVVRVLNAKLNLENTPYKVVDIDGHLVFAEVLPDGTLIHYAGFIDCNSERFSQRTVSQVLDPSVFKYVKKFKEEGIKVLNDSWEHGNVF